MSAERATIYTATSAVTLLESKLASNLSLEGHIFIAATAPGISLTFIDDAYVGRVARVYYRLNDTEKWYLHDADRGWVEIDKDQLWFWTPEWQAGEREVDQEYEQGLAKRFDNIDDLLDSLLE